MPTPTPDIIDRLAGIQPGSRLHAIRSERPEARDNAQKSYLALFEPDVPSTVTAEERLALAAFVAGLHGEPTIAEFYQNELARSGARAGVSEAVEQEIAAAAGQGPYGHYPEGPLSREDKDGPGYKVRDTHRLLLGSRLVAAFEHAHLLVFHPRDASASALGALLAAGFSTTDIVTLSQLVTFLAFQIRVVAGLRVVAAAA